MPKIALPVLQTNFSEIQEIIIFTFKQFNFTRTQLDLNFISHIYYKVFSSSKYNLKCLIELPILNNLEINVLDEYIPRAQAYNKNVVYC